jgi:hypothetical protein
VSVAFIARAAYARVRAASAPLAGMPSSAAPVATMIPHRLSLAIMLLTPTPLSLSLEQL